MASAVFLIVLALPLVSSQSYHWGACPDPKFLGTWYEIEKLPASFERGKCIEAKYAVRTDGTIQVLNSQFYFSYFTPYAPYWVVTTDYSTVAVVYSCTDILHVFHVDYAWILGRSRFIDPKTVQYAKQLLAGEGVDIYRMKATDQMGCMN
ncbi:hypothetical protein NHX12_021548 [Muraenolepis orangiensis]|uniref:Lipocalin/cytosolic fatty-acid binding domain-containing protein n=1 Tax=Muraenolepis orangiensis TaxID=630683 RepID=A0A9Q0IVM7_9TELE|nr:hypothetical protein NHX12_021548 [Muraenolepis orangiensis]